MKKSLLSAVLALSVFFAHSQERVKVLSGDNLSDYFTFLFPSFSDAVVLFKNGSSSKVRMNFNTFLSKMQFINPSGDTLVLSGPETIEYIRLNDYLFFYNRYYYQIIDAADSLKLTVCRKTTFDHASTGALGTTTHGNIESYDSYITPGGDKKLLVRDDMDVIHETIYSLIGKNGATISANKSGFIKTFPDKKKDIENFLKTNKVDFNNFADLDKLFQFCKSQGK
ncbi:MAG: hypothetical protein P4L51_21360 [Puia sp.]|nr:hypothetical protein [Puia sp.]